MLINVNSIKGRAVTTLCMVLLSPLVSAYMIENQRPDSGYFYGQFCASCWHGTIPPGEAGGCNGYATGCKNDTWIYLKMKNYTVYYPGDGYSSSRCFATANKPVTAHGKVVFAESEILVYDDAGTLIDRTGYNYWYEGDFGILKRVSRCGN